MFNHFVQKSNGFSWRVLAASTAVIATTQSTMIGCEQKADEKSTIDTKIEKDQTSTKATGKIEYLGVFLDGNSKDQLRKRFQHRSDNSQHNHCLVLKYNPTPSDLNQLKNHLGKEVTLKVHAYAEDENAQTIIVSAKTEEGPLAYGSQVPHIALSVGNAERDGYPFFYADVLLERLQKNESIAVKEEDGGASVSVKSWAGELEEFDSKLVPLLNPYPPTKSKIEALDDMAELKGIVCKSSGFDAETFSCQSDKQETECGFCLFMRAGPCGDEFHAWEKCLDQCKKEGQDFIAQCGPETLKLRDCVDLHPEYYSVLKEDSSKEEEPAASSKEESKTSEIQDNAAEENSTTSKANIESST